MNQDATVHSLVETALSGAEWDELFRRGSGSQRSDVLKHVAGRIVRGRWDVPSETVPGYRERLPAETAEAAQRLIERLLPTIREAVHLQKKVVAMAMESVQEFGLKATAAELSEPSCSAVGTAYAQDPPEPLDPGTLGREIGIAWRDRPVGLGKRAFVDSWREFYQQEWAQYGTRSLVEFPPSAIGLGRDEAPPFDARVNENSWLLGTDRSVWGRYRLHFLTSARSCSSARPASERFAHTADACATEEISRTCRGYGLTAHRHRVALRSISAAPVEAGPAALSRSIRAWKLWMESVHQVSDDAVVDGELAAAAAAKITLWFRYSSPARELVKKHGPPDPYVDLISRALVRKLWMGLHCLEREHLPPASSDQLNPLLFAALDKAVPEAVMKWLTEASPEAPSEARINATTPLLLSNPSLVDRLWRDPTTEILDEYADLARARYGVAWTDHVLDRQELKDLIEQHPKSEDE
ncbi:hypothetical protein AB0P21_20960 [Kribbella sp. NPDC056861]|uniref:hypothetical protein n=1 Tax=Kribbella sp. NPDC056861 TaxID=3154857 RepID=UPI003434947B